MRFTSVRGKLQMWGEKTTWHALPTVFESRHYFVKLIAFVLFVASAIFCVRTLTVNLFDYLQYEVNTVLTVARNKDTQFPAVSVCTVQICDLVNYNYTTYFNPTQKSNPNASLSWSADETAKNFLLYYNKANLQQATGGDGSSAVVDKNNASIQDILISCKYGDEWCSADDFVFFQTNEFNKCYMFNTGRDRKGKSQPIRTAQRFSKAFGLHLELLSNSPENCKSPLNRAVGMLLFVHSSTYMVTDEATSVQLHAGYETSIAVDRTLVKRLATPYSDCVKNNEKVAYSGINEYIDYTFEV